MTGKEKAALSFKTEAASERYKHSHSIPRRSPAQLRGITGFERLRAEWINANPEHTEAELLAACITFARACGLILRERLLQEQLRGAGYERIA